MSNNSYTNNKLSFSKQCLLDGYVSLLMEKKIDDITITELCEKSGICRSTFHRHYKKPMDILVEYLISKPLGFDIDMKPDDYSTRERIELYFQYLQKNKDFFSCLIEQNQIHLLLETMEYCFRGPFLPIINNMGFIDQYKISAFIGIVYMVSVDWIKGEFGNSDVDFAVERSFDILEHFNMFK